MRWADTGLAWRATSPFIQSLDAAYGYPMTGLGCWPFNGFVHGVGSAYPFRLLQYAGRTPEQLQAALIAEHIAGLDFRIVSIQQPGGKVVRGVFVYITDWNAWRPTQLAFRLLRLSARFAKESGRPNPYAGAPSDEALLFNKHTGSQELWSALVRDGGNADVEGLYARWTQADAQFQERSRKFWIYR